MRRGAFFWIVVAGLFINGCATYDADWSVDWGVMPGIPADKQQIQLVIAYSTTLGFTTTESYDFSVYSGLTKEEVAIKVEAIVENEGTCDKVTREGAALKFEDCKRYPKEVRISEKGDGSGTLSAIGDSVSLNSVSVKLAPR